MQIVVNTGGTCVPLRIDATTLSVAPGTRVLLAGVAVPRDSALDVVPVAGSGMPRALAHFDHVGTEPPRAGEPAAVCWPVEAAVEDPGVAAGWLIAQLARGPGHPLLAALRQHLARSESYGLMRFLLAEGGDHTVAALAQRYGLSPAQFHRRCRQVLGRPLKRELRIQRAARTLLAYPGRTHSFTHLAADHGYASLSHFCTDIKALIGCSPLSVYRAVKTPAE